MKASTRTVGALFAALSTAAVLSTAAATSAANAASPERPRDPVALGRYLVQTTGCNDCHTAGYGPSGGKVPEAEWLQGDTIGFGGPWGTTYPTNLRLWFDGLTEAQWLQRARTMTTRPPMPWFNLRAMSDADLRAIYRYVRSAGPAGQPAPAARAPGAAASGPVVKFP